MAYESNWYFEPNVLFSPGSVAELTKYQLWRLKAFLKGEIGGATQGLWTVLGSSDGVTGAMDGADRWGATFDAALIPQAATGTAHGWMVLRSPGYVVSGATRYQWLFLSANSATANIASVRFIGHAAPTGGTATADPTIGSAGMVGTMTMNNNSATAVRFHAGLNDRGDFYFFTMRVGSGYVQHAVIHSIVATPKANDLFPFWAYATYSDTNTGNFQTGGALASHNGLYSLRGDSPHPTANNANSGAFIALPTCYSSSTSGASTTYFQTVDGVDSTVPDLPLIVFSASNPICVRGRVPDFAGTAPGVNIPANSVLRDGSNNVEYAVMGHLLVPINVVPDIS